MLRFIFRTVEILTIFWILSAISISQRGNWKFLQTPIKYTGKRRQGKGQMLTGKLQAKKQTNETQLGFITAQDGPLLFQVI